MSSRHDAEQIRLDNVSRLASGSDRNICHYLRCLEVVDRVDIRKRNHKPQNLKRSAGCRKKGTSSRSSAMLPSSPNRYASSTVSMYNRSSIQPFTAATPGRSPPVDGLRPAIVDRGG